MGSILVAAEGDAPRPKRDKAGPWLRRLREAMRDQNGEKYTIRRFLWEHPGFLWTVILAAGSVVASYSVMLHKVIQIEDWIEKQEVHKTQQARDIRDFYAEKWPKLVGRMASVETKVGSMSEDVAEIKKLLQGGRRPRRRRQD